eukprot:13141714-Ditylum_brightwellii.AAC.1
MSRLSLPSVSLSFLDLLGDSGGQNSWWTWKANYVVCRKKREGLNGIFCGNFGCSQGGWKPCCW